MADVEYCGFVWDSDKAKNNKKKHGVSFETAIRIFSDPCLYTEYDQENSETAGEYREKHIGYFPSCPFLLVSTTDREERKRLISARKANSREVQIYEQNAALLQAD